MDQCYNIACVEELSYAGSKMADFSLLAGDLNGCRMQRKIPNGSLVQCLPVSGTSLFTYNKKQLIYTIIIHSIIRYMY